MIFKIVTTIIIFIAFISVKYGCFEGIRKKDDKLTLMCSLASGLIGFLLGLSLSNILFGI